MKNLIIRSSSLGHWHSLVSEAEAEFGQQLTVDLESYLVYLLEYYTDKPELTTEVMAEDYLRSLEAVGRNRLEKLRAVGDKCLLFSGFFPEVANKRQVTVSYYVELGRRAYHYLAVSQPTNENVFLLLDQQFICLVDLLFSIRELGGEQEALNCMQAEELWRNAGSQYAFKVLKRHHQHVILTQSVEFSQKH